jgi:eukaryotic-like serine/threonine-protein kinase
MADLLEIHAIADELRKHDLLEPKQLAALTEEKLAKFPDSETLAKTLVRNKLLTAFQAARVLQGRAADLVLGKYILLERLGTGGMGEVFKAKQRTFSRIVAVKVLKTERWDDPVLLQRFQREMVAAARVQHPHIVQALDADCVKGRHFLVMEYVAGTDLAKRVGTDGPLSVREACDYIRQAAIALQHLHECGLAITHDGQAVAVSGDDKLTVLSRTGGKRKEWSLPGPLRGVAFSQDDKHLLVAGKGGVFVLRQ